VRNIQRNSGYLLDVRIPDLPRGIQNPRRALVDLLFCYGRDMLSVGILSTDDEKFGIAVAWGIAVKVMLKLTGVEVVQPREDVSML
jgi:hypothetical protein